MNVRSIANVCDSTASFLLDPFQTNFSKSKQLIALSTTALVALTTVGTVHAGCGLWRRYHPHSPNITQKIIKKAFNTAVHPLQEAPIEPKPIDPITLESEFAYTKSTPEAITPDDFTTCLMGKKFDFSSEAIFTALPHLVTFLTTFSAEQQKLFQEKFKKITQKLECFKSTLSAEEINALLVYCTLKPSAVETFLTIFEHRFNKITLVHQGQKETLSFTETLLLAEESEYFKGLFGHLYSEHAILLLEEEGEHCKGLFGDFYREHTMHEIVLHDQESHCSINNLKLILKLLKREESPQLEDVLIIYASADRFLIPKLKNEALVLARAYVDSLDSVDCEFMEAIAETMEGKVQDLIEQQLQLVDNPDDFSRLIALTSHVTVPSQASDEWFSSISNHQHITNLNLGQCIDITDKALEGIATLAKLKHLNLTNCNQLTDSGLSALVKLEGLIELDLKKCRRITGSGFKDFRSNATLKYLCLDDCINLTDEGLLYLRQAYNLTHLFLNQCNSLTENGLSILKNRFKLKHLEFRRGVRGLKLTKNNFSNLKKLEVLNLAFVDLTAVGLSIIPQNNRLKHLDITDCPLPFIGQDLIRLKQLECLRIDYDKISYASDSIAQLFSIEQLIKLTALTELALKGSIDDRQLELIATHLTDLRVLEFDGLNTTQVGWEQLSKLKLESLRIDYFNLDDTAINLIQNWPTLEILEFRYSHRFSGQGFDQLHDHPNLKKLILFMCKGVNDAGMKAISNLTNLEALSLDNCHTIKSKSFNHLASLTQLRFLNLRGCGLEDLNFLSQMNALKHLNLAFAHKYLHQIQSIAPLANAKDLTFLNLEHFSGLTDEEFRILENFTKLKHLNLTECSKIGSETLYYLRNASQLEFLAIDCLNIAKQDFRHLSHFKHLRELQLSGPKVTKKALRYLNHLKALEKASFLCPKLSVVDIRKLGTHCQNLSEMDLNHKKYSFFPTLHHKQ